MVVVLVSVIESSCQMESRDKPNESLDELRKLIALPATADFAKWQLVTLPDRQGDAIPGPTDYVALVAIVGMKESDTRTYVLSMSPVSPETGIQKSFIRSWLPRNVAAALTDVTRKSSVSRIYDALPVSRRPAKRAFAIPVPEGLAIYVEYVAP